MVVEADVSDAAAVAAAVEAVRARWGDIHGVIHAAGIQRVDAFGAVADIDAAAAREHLRPKLDGLAALAAAIDLDRLDFCVTLSSLATVLGAVGHGSYAAANAAMDGLADALFAAGRHRVLSVDWDSWPSAAGRGPLGGRASQVPMSYADGAAALERALGAVGRVPRLVHSVTDLARRIERSTAVPASARMARHARPPLGEPFVAPADELEAALAEVWQDVLAIERIGVHDGFAELGGDSLMALRVIGGVRDALGIRVPVATFAACRTVRELADGVRDIERSRTGGTACSE
jgi:acyl carrier protein